MSKEDEIEDYGDVEKLILLIAKHHKKGLKPTRLQKLTLVITAVLTGSTKKLQDAYGAYFFGGFSDDVEESANVLSEEGYLEYIKDEGYVITQEGKELTEKIAKKYPDKDKIIRKITTNLEDLSDKEILALTYSLFPQLTKNSVIKDMPYVRKTKNVYTVKIKEKELREILGNLEKEGKSHAK